MRAVNRRVVILPSSIFFSIKVPPKINIQIVTVIERQIIGESNDMSINAVTFPDSSYDESRSEVERVLGLYSRRQLKWD